MPDFDQLNNKVNALTTFVNSVRTLSKKIFELPESTDGTKLVAVYNNDSGFTEQFNLTDALDSVYQLTDGLLTRGTITQDDTTYTYSVGFTGRINGIVYGNTEDKDVEILPADPGFYRFDIVVLDTSNNIRVIIGLESDTVASIPEIEPNTILISTYYISGDTVGVLGENIRLIAKGFLNGVRNTSSQLQLGDAGITIDSDGHLMIGIWYQGLNGQDPANYNALFDSNYAPVTN